MSYSCKCKCADPEFIISPTPSLCLKCGGREVPTSLDWYVTGILVTLVIIFIFLCIFIYAGMLPVYWLY